MWSSLPDQCPSVREQGHLLSTPYHSQYWAHALTVHGSGGTIESLSRSISSARVDLNPHQVEAANSFLEGKSLDETTTAKVADLLLEKAHVQPFNGYKIPIARALIHRTLMKLTA